MYGIFLDSETTGLHPVKHAIIDIAFKIIDLTTGHCKTEYHSVVKQPQSVWDQKDIHSIAINQFSWEEIQQGLPAKVVAENIIDRFNAIPINRDNAVFICQNPSFDRGFFIQLVDTYRQEELNWPYHWLDLASMFWAAQVAASQREGTPIPDSIRFSKNAIARTYHIPPENDRHRSMNGVNHLIACYKAVLNLNWTHNKEETL